ncbi:MAG: nicotinamide mononucleotide transporter, partial [Ruminiclostridium sp.]|nr:nicotinamide mononucleotide transporter [Ruminiclostridium sp.]
NKAEVKVNHISRKEVALLPLLTVVVTAVFFFIMRYFGTANLLPSTLSITTSFVAVYLTFRRDPFYAVAYALNDLVLIVLWSLAALTDKSYISVVVCFVVFLANDIYGFINWRKMKKRQAGTAD